MTKIRNLQDIVTDFLKNIDLLQDDQLASIIHVLEVEIMEREYAKNGMEYPEAR
jgi:hypothetical protein